jgi:SpoVK/Ycf46/Vps4 family AAA+-type ATPase
MSANDEMNAIFRQMFIDSRSIPNFETGSSSGAPQSYTSARNAIEKYLLKSNHHVAWDDVIGNERAKQALLEAIEEPVRNADLYRYYNMASPKGVLLYGPPGCGKTMFAKASATAMSRIYGKQVDIIAISGTEIQQPYVGVTEQIIRGLFLFAREYRAYHGHPCVMFIDEAETLLPDRTGRVRRVAPWEESQVAEFLSELDGMKELGAFVILATNRPEAIDEALLRDGRCDLKIKVERPNKAAAGAILYDALRDLPTKARLDDLVFAAVEAFHDPAYVIHEGRILVGRGDKLEKEVTVNMCLEHIINGAMLKSVARRAKSFAFQRDRDSNTRNGVILADIIEAVREIYNENKDLEHAFAVQEFTESLRPQAEALQQRVNQSKGKLQ